MAAEATKMEPRSNGVGAPVAQPHVARRAARYGLRAVLTVAMVVVVATTLASAQPLAVPGAPDGAAPDRSVAPTRLTAEQQAALEEAQLRYTQYVWLVNMGRTLAPPARPTMQPAPELWRLNRRMVLLEAALRVHDLDARGYLELYQARREAAAAYAAHADELLRAAGQLDVAGRKDDSNRLAGLADQARRHADALRLGSVEALSRYGQLQPGDLNMWQALLAEKLDVADLESVEKRIELLRAELASLESQKAAQGSAPAAPPEKISTVLTMLASYLIRREGNTEEAAQLLSRAVALVPLNLQAKSLLLQAAKSRGKDQPADYLDLLLTDFRLNPVKVTTAGEIAAFLARHGIYQLPVTVGSGDKARATDRGAAGFCEYAAVLWASLFKDQAVPPEIRLAQARALALAGQTGEAGKLILAVIKQREPDDLLAGAGDPSAALPPIDVAARLLLAEMLAPSDKAAAEAERKTVIDYCRAHKDKPALAQNGSLLAWLSWFLLQTRATEAGPAATQPASTPTALGLARLAAAVGGVDEPLIRRSLGAALAVQGDANAKEKEAAAALLAPLAKGDDPWSRFYLAHALRASGQADAADAELGALATAWPGDPAGLAARKQLGANAPPLPAGDPLKAALTALPQGLFDYHRVPGEFGSIVARLYSGTEAFQPVSFEFLLTNKTGKPSDPGAFAVTVGDGLMVWPVILVSAEVKLPGEPSPRVLRDFCQLRIPAPQLLDPGQAVPFVDVADVGPLDQLLRLTPQAPKEIRVEFLVNPAVSTTDEWVPGPGGYPIVGTFARNGLAVTQEDLLDLAYSSRTGSVRAKLAANRLFGSLLAEQQLAAARRLSYEPAAALPSQLSKPLEEAAADPDPRVRAFLADAVYPAGLSGKLLLAVSRGLSDSNWLVRLLTVRLLGDRIGQAASKDITAMLAKETDPLVRRLAQSYLDQWSEQKGR